VTRRFVRGLWIGGLFQKRSALCAGLELCRFDAREMLAAPEFAEQGLSEQGRTIWRSVCFPCNGSMTARCADPDRHLLKPDACSWARFWARTLSELRESFAHAETATRGGISPRVRPSPMCAIWARSYNVGLCLR